MFNPYWPSIAVLVAFFHSVSLLQVIVNDAKKRALVVSVVNMDCMVVMVVALLMVILFNLL